ncbi:Glutamate decarboxylase, partial [Thalictrum thalictroides]
NRCVNMIANLFNAPLGDSETAVGVGTVGSSEAIMLAGLISIQEEVAEQEEG